jgi:tRNA-guanine family transglycosylase
MGELYNFCAGAELHVAPAKYVNAMLANVPDDACSPSAINSTRRMWNALKPEHVILDSGGYQILMGEENDKKISFDESRPIIRNEFEINLTPFHVVNAAARLKPDTFVGLDFPIRKLTDPSERKLEFMRKIGFNVIFAKKCHDLRLMVCPDIQFFLPIQCYNLEQLDQFMDMISGINYDGFSMPVRNLSPNQIILFMIKFYQLGVRQVHILGTSALFNIVIAAFMARHLFDWVSFDATTWRLWAEYSRYMNPHNLLHERIAQDVRINESIHMDCRCPFCKNVTFTYIKNLPETERTNFLRCHNWWVIEKASRDLFEASGNALALKRCLRSRGVAVKNIDQLCNGLSIAFSMKDRDIGFLQNLFGL